jgi:flagellum-specific peptidoglycan hydrolase FlgJ
MSEYATTSFKKKVGTRIQVFEGIALETSGGLRKKDLIISKTGSIVSKKASQSAKDRLASGKGLCEYCIKKYEESLSKKKSSKKESKKKSSKKESKKESKKKSSKKESKKESKKKSSKKESKKKSSKKELVLKIKKPKGVTKDKIKELEKEIEKLREKAGRIAEKEGKMTKEVKNILELVTNKVREMIAMKKVLKEKNKKSII